MNNRQQKTRLAFLKNTFRQAWVQLRTWFSQDPGDKATERLQKEHAQALLTTGKELKAGVAKVHQLLGYFQGTTEITTLSAKFLLTELYDQIPGESQEVIEQVFLEDFGKKPEELFTFFEKESFAAASLGEVHHAKNNQNQEYAVKIQYPHIAKALETDLENETILEQLMGASLGETLSSEARSRIKQIILEELDYQKEAQYLTLFSQAFSFSTEFIFPQAIPSLCSKRILTATYLEGKSLLSFLQNASQEAKNSIGMKLFFYGYASPLQHRLVNADPNPGNFLIMNQGAQIGLVDFGCCLQLTEDQATFEQVFWQSILAEDAEVLRYTLHRMGFIKSAVEFDSSSYRLWEKLLILPFQTSQFTWTNEYAKELISTTQSLVQGKRFTLSADFLLLWRQRLGLISLLGQTQAQGNFRYALFQILKTVNMAPKGINELPN